MSRIKELEEKILDRSATEAEVIEHHDLLNGRTHFAVPAQTVKEFVQGNLQGRINFDQGTPKTLDQAIELSIRGHLSQVPDNAYHTLRDYLSQHFGAAMLRNPEHEEAFKLLFDRIVRRK